MTYINWYEEVLKRKDSLLEDTIRLLQIKSVLDEEHASEDAPLGEGVREALVYMLEKGKAEGFAIKNVDQLAGHIEYGSGEDLVGILCHVDVVPEGDGWSVPPYEGTIKDGKIYARGSLDDKGPTMAAFYALKIVKELNLPLSKRVRIIIGTDEESNWRCVNRYFDVEEMPKMGFAPDADFPIIFAEKGIADMDLLFEGAKVPSVDAQFKVRYFSSGRRYNMVPDFAKASITGDNLSQMKKDFARFLSAHQLKGDCAIGHNEAGLSIEGKSAHSMEPDHGINAGLYLASFLASQPIEENAKTYFQFINEFLFQDSRGKKLGIHCADEITGDLTMNAAVFSYDEGGNGKIGLNFRYPVTCHMEDGKNKIEKIAAKYHFTPGHFSDSKPHHVDKNDPLIQILQKVYEEQTGQKAELLSIGGGTYARSLKSGVAFGPLFPGRPDVAHQKDEYIEIEDLLKATAIYAQAIHELAK